MDEQLLPDEPVLVLLGLCIQVRDGTLPLIDARRIAVSQELAARASADTCARVADALTRMTDRADPLELALARLAALHALALEHRGEDRLALQLLEAVFPVVQRLAPPALVGEIQKNRAGLLGATGSPEAGAEFVAALRLLREHGPPYELALGLLNYANFLQGRWELDTAEVVYAEALPLLREHGSPDEVGIGLMNRAIMLDKSERFEAALTAFDEARAHLEQYAPPAEVALCRMNRAEALRKVNRTDEARAEFEAALPGLRAGPQQHYYGVCLLGLGNLDQRAGDLTAAVGRYDDALLVLRRHSPPGQIAICLVNRALALQELGRHAEALAGYDEALALMRGHTPPVELGMVLLNRGLTLKAQGKTQDALVALEEAVGLLRDHPLRENYALGLMGLAEVLVEVGRHDEADPHYRDALAVLEARPVPALHATARLSLANALSARGRYADAITEYSRALPLLAAHGPPSRHGQCLMNRGIARFAAGDTSALDDLDAAVDLLRATAAELVRPDLYTDALVNRANLLRRTGHPREALADYALARRELRAALRRAGADDTTLGFHTEYAPLFRGAVGAALDAADPEAAYEVVRDGKAGIVGGLFRVAPGTRADEPDTVLAARRALTAHLRVPTAGADAERDALTRAYLAEWGRHANAYDAARAAPPEVEEPPTLDQIRVELLDRWAIIDYWRTEHNEFRAFVVLKDELHIFTLPFPADANRESYLGLLAALRTVTDAEPDLGTLNDLGTRFFRPFVALLREKGVTGLYLVPHDFLHGFPLHAARFGTKYLCDEFAIAYLPSANLLPRLPKPDPSGPVFVLANPEVGTDYELPLSHWEGIEVRDLLDVANDKCHIGKNATLAATDQWGGCGYVHFSCHGSGDEALAARSHLRLADDLLLAHDVLHRKPALKPGAVVVLNGCETSVPDWRAVNEGMGLMTAFLLRGAGAVLSTQWSVFDRCAARVALSFAEGLRAGAGVTGALADARARLRAMTVENMEEEFQRAPGRKVAIPDWVRRTGFDHPVFWAAFQLVGRAM